MAKYFKKEMVDLNGTGRTQAYYKMMTWRNVGHEEFVKRCSYNGSGLSRATVDSVLTMVADELPRLLAEGYSVSIDGIGTFTAKLGVRKDVAQDSFEPDEQKRNVRTIEVSGVNFRVDKALVAKTDSSCRLEREGEIRLSRPKYTQEERLAMANQYVAKHALMRVSDYAALTGLSRTVASVELRQLCQHPDATFMPEGSGSHKVYVAVTIQRLVYPAHK